MPSLSSLGTLFFRGGLVRKVITGYSGDTFPNFTPNPIFGDAYRAGAVEVEHWSFLAFAQRLEAAARGLPAVVDALDRRARRWRRTTRTHASTRRSARSACSRRSCPTSRCCTRRSPTVPATSRCTRRCSRACGARSPRARGAIVTVERVVDDLAPLVAPRADPRAPRARGVRGAAGCPPRGPVRRRSSRRRLRRGLRVLGRGARGDAPRRLRRVDPALGARRRRSGRVPRAARARARRRAAGEGGARVVAHRRGRVPARSRCAAQPLGARRGLGRAPPRRARASRSMPTRCSPVRASRTSPRGSASRRRAAAGSDGRAHRRDRAVGLRPDAGRPVRAQPPQLLALDDARRRGRWCSARSSAVRARRRSRASAARRSTGSAT